MKYLFANCEIDTRYYELRSSGKVVPVEPQVFDSLVHVISNPGRLITKDELVEAIWNGRAVSDSVISTRIKDARKAIGDDGDRQAVIKTIPRRGIRMAVPVEMIPDGIAKVVEVSLAPMKLQAVDGQATERPGTSLPMIGFAPFALLPPDPGLEYLATGLCDELASELGRYHSLAVLVRHSAQQVTGHESGDYRGLKALGATHALRGSVQIQDTLLRVSLQLIQLDSQRLLWAERYAIGREELFAMQNDAIACIVEAIWGRVLDDRLAGARIRPTSSLDAYDCVLRGMASHRGGGLNNCSLEDAASAIAWYERAIELDPGYARAYAWRSCASAALWPSNPSQAHLDSCQAYADKALELDPLDFEANRITAGLSLYLRRFDAAAHHVDKMRALNPNDTQVLIKGGLWSSYLGNHGRSVADVERAMRRNPLHSNWYWRDAGIVLFNHGDYEGAWQALKQVPIVRHSDLVYRTACLAGLGEIGEAGMYATRLRDEHREITLPQLHQWLPYGAYKYEQDSQRLSDLLGQAGLV
jgi:DNA-binding winged helix-turn-helix (wHTH) protein/tetratricopeptide (TPR) repeat protein